MSLVEIKQVWQLFVDGMTNEKGSRIGIVMISPDGITLEKSLRLGFSSINNKAKYKALLAGVIAMQKLGSRVVRAYCDSKLIIGQVQGDFKAKDPRMLWYLNQVKRLSGGFLYFTFEQVPQSKNSHVDSLATLATASRENLPRIILMEDYALPTYDVPAPMGIHFTQVGPSWMDPLFTFLRNGILPEDKTEAKKVHRKVPRFWLSDDQKLYKRSYLGPYLLCIHPEAMEILLEELHKRICGSHTEGRSIAHRALTQGYWWPSIQKSSQEYVKKCNQCQRYASNIHQPGGVLNPLSSPWPFAQWGLDIVGPFPKAIRNRRYLIVATDYFTKWIEAEPLANIRDQDVKRFIWRNILTRFGVPNTLISYNGLQFDSKAFQRYYYELRIKNRYSTPSYPQSNGQARPQIKSLWMV